MPLKGKRFVNTKNAEPVKALHLDLTAKGAGGQSAFGRRNETAEGAAAAGTRRKQSPKIEFGAAVNSRNQVVK